MEVKILVIFVFCTTQVSGQLFGAIAGAGLAKPNNGGLNSLYSILDDSFAKINKQLEDITLPPNDPTPPPPEPEDPEEGDGPESDESAEGDGSEGNGPEDAHPEGGQPDKGTGSDSNDSPTSGASNPSDGGSNQGSSSDLDKNTFQHPEFPETHPSRDENSPPFDFESNFPDIPNFPKPYGGDELPYSNNPWLDKHTPGDPYDYKNFPKPFEEDNALNSNNRWKPSDLPNFNPEPLDNSWYNKPIGPYDYKSDPKPFSQSDQKPYNPNMDNPWLDNLKPSGAYNFNLKGQESVFHTGSNFEANFFDKGTGFEGSLKGTQDLWNPATGNLDIGFPMGDFDFKGGSNLDKNYDFGFNLRDNDNTFLKGSSNNGVFPTFEFGVDAPLYNSNDHQLNLQIGGEKSPTDFDRHFRFDYNNNGYSGYYGREQNGFKPPIDSFGGSLPIDGTPLTIGGGYGKNPHVLLNVNDHSIKLIHNNGRDITGAEFGTSFDTNGNQINIGAQVGSENKLEVKVDSDRTGSSTSFTAQRTKGSPSNLGVETSVPIYQSKDLDLKLQGSASVDGNGIVTGGLEVQGSF